MPTQADEATRAALNPITSTQIAGVAQAVAHLNAAVASAPDATSTELGQYYAETQVMNTSLAEEKCLYLYAHVLFESHS